MLLGSREIYIVLINWSLRLSPSYLYSKKYNFQLIIKALGFKLRNERMYKNTISHTISSLFSHSRIFFIYRFAAIFSLTIFSDLIRIRQPIREEQMGNLTVHKPHTKLRCSSGSYRPSGPLELFDTMLEEAYRK